MWEPHANGTFTSGRLVHTGQFFIDDSLNEVIDKVRSFAFSAGLRSDERRADLPLQPQPYQGQVGTYSQLARKPSDLPGVAQERWASVSHQSDEG